MAEASASIIVEPESTTELRNKQLSSPAWRFIGQHGVGSARRFPLKRLGPAAPPARFVLIIYDCKQACEARAAPHRRTPPLQLLRLKHSIGATLEARAKAAGLHRIAILPGGTYVLFDGGKEGNRSKMKAAFVDDQGNALKPKVVRTLQLVFSEDMVAERRGCTRGAASLRQGQRCLLVTQPKPVTPTRKRSRFVGTNRGGALVGVPAGVESMWSLPLGKKRALVGKVRVDFGGPMGTTRSLR